jgi:hypothetical protein
MRRARAAPRALARALALLCALSATAAADAPPSSSSSSSSDAAAAEALRLPPGTGRFVLEAPVALEDSGLCTYTYQPLSPPDAAPLVWRLNRGGGPHARGLNANAGAHRVDVGAGEDATSFYFQARARAHTHTTKCATNA